MAYSKVAVIAAFLVSRGFALPAPADTNATTSYACNPAHSYPNGQYCTSVDGSLTLASSTAAVTTGFACNPAHSYPGGQYCTSESGSLTLKTSSAVPTSTEFACNPAHSYPNGQYCTSESGSLTLKTSSASATTTYACNPAHSYPGGAYCTSVSGSLTLLTSATPSTSGYACNPAHSYPNGQYCDGSTGTPVLRTSSTAAPSSSGFACNPAHSYPGGAYCTSVSGSLTLLISTTSAPAAASTSAYACNPAHSYPNGQYCDGSTGTPVLRTSSVAPAQSQPAVVAQGEVTKYVTVTVTAGCSAPAGPALPASGVSSAGIPSPAPPAGTTTPAAAPPASSPAASSMSAYLCNPAHQYPAGQCCDGTNGTPTLRACPTNTITKPYTNSTMTASAVPAPTTSSASKCPLDLQAGSFEYPHLLEVNGQNGYFGKVAVGTNTTFTFDIPAADAGKDCNTYFVLPAKGTMETSDYTLALTDGAQIAVSKDGQGQVAQFTPATNQKWLVYSEKCAAGKQVKYNMGATGGMSLEWFQDYNPCALGMYIVVS